MLAVDFYNSNFLNHHALQKLGYNEFDQLGAFLQKVSARR